MDVSMSWTRFRSASDIRLTARSTDACRPTCAAGAIEPVYTRLKGWKPPPTASLSTTSCPLAAQDYLIFSRRSPAPHRNGLHRPRPRPDHDGQRLRPGAKLNTRNQKTEIRDRGPISHFSVPQSTLISVLSSLFSGVPMISFTVRMTFRPEDREEIATILRELAAASRTEPGVHQLHPASRRVRS